MSSRVSKFLDVFFDACMGGVATLLVVGTTIVAGRYYPHPDWSLGIVVGMFVGPLVSVLLTHWQHRERFKVANTALIEMQDERVRLLKLRADLSARGAAVTDAAQRLDAARARFVQDCADHDSDEDYFDEGDEGQIERLKAFVAKLEAVRLQFADGADSQARHDFMKLMENESDSADRNGLIDYGFDGLFSDLQGALRLMRRGKVQEAVAEIDIAMNRVA